MSRAAMLLAYAAVLAWVLVIGSIADLHDPVASTSFALGIVAVAGPFVAVAWVEKAGRR